MMMQQGSPRFLTIPYLKDAKVVTDDIKPIRPVYRPIQRMWRLVIKWHTEPTKRDRQCLAVFGSMTCQNHTILQRKGRSIVATLRNAESAHVENQHRAQIEREVRRLRRKWKSDVDQTRNVVD
jgi:hypothetical protein